MRAARESLAGRLADARGNRVVFLSHCLLNENVRYLGGAFHPGATPQAARLLDSGVGICQMPCPEQRAWGGVHKPRMLLAYGLSETPAYRMRGLLLRLFLLQTRARYWWLARRVAREVQECLDAGVAVVAVIGVGASPSCGVQTTLDVARSFDVLAGCPLAAIDRALVNQQAVAGCRTGGEGLFIRALRRRLRRRGIDVPFLEHDLIAEMNGVDRPYKLDVR